MQVRRQSSAQRIVEWVAVNDDRQVSMKTTITTIITM